MDHCFFSLGFRSRFFDTFSPDFAHRFCWCYWPYFWRSTPCIFADHFCWSYTGHFWWPHLVHFTVSCCTFSTVSVEVSQRKRCWNFGGFSGHLCVMVVIDSHQRSCCAADCWVADCWTSSTAGFAQHQFLNFGHSLISATSGDGFPICLIFHSAASFFCSFFQSYERPGGRNIPVWFAREDPLVSVSAAVTLLCSRIRDLNFFLVIIRDSTYF